MIFRAPALLLCFAAVACQQAPRSRPEAQTSAQTQMQCRQQVDRVYAAQNRGDLSRRDERDSPFAGTYLPGITTRELGARYARDNQMSSCLNQNRGGAATDNTPGPTFSPVQP